jgi:uncharacterized protein (DUF2164 family)
MKPEEKSRTKLVVTKSLIAQADEVASAHEQFNLQYVVGGRAALYQLLGRMLSLVQQFESAPDRKELISKIRRQLRSEHGIKTQANSSDTTVLVRYMTRTDRKTAHVYARAIESAKANSISCDQLPSYIEKAGGLEQIRLDGSMSDASENNRDQAERVELAEEYLRCRAEVPIQSFDANRLFDNLDKGGALYSYFVCARKGDGKYYILSRIPASRDFERLVVRNFSELIGEDLAEAKEVVSGLRAKANEVIKARRADAERNAQKLLTT